MKTYSSMLDDINQQILHELQTDARISYTEIGRRVGLTGPAVAERVSRMEELGIIIGYETVLDSEKLGYPISVFIQVVSSRGECTPISEYVRDMPCVEACYHVAGERDVLLKGSFRSVAQLETLVENLAQYGNVSTSLVLSTRFRRAISPKGP
ncbi:MAG: Lrp/AsnC family transcriptional regulator [Chloroflexota bacterium]